MDNRKILMCYGRTEYTPGRYLEDGFRAIGWHVDRYSVAIDFKQVDWRSYAAVLFVESPSKPPVKVSGIERVTIPKLFWVHHGENRLDTNVALCGSYRPDILLMAHSMHLADKFRVPARFFPFAMATDLFNCSDPLAGRTTDIASVGSTVSSIYQNRRLALDGLRARFGGKYRLAFRSGVYLRQLANAYSNAKIVFNHSADRIASLNMRLFEGIGCGALMLTDFVPGLEKLFVDKKHLVLFRDRKELLELADYYLRHPDEAQAIASAGYRHLLSRHTYGHRAQEIAAIVRSLG